MGWEDFQTPLNSKKSPSMNPSKPLPLTGELKELSTQFKTKDNAVPAGPSPPLLLWRVLTSSRLDPFSNLLNLNLLIAPSKTVDAMVDLRLLLSLMLCKTQWSLKLLTHTLLGPDLANIANTRESSKLHPTLLSNTTVSPP